jgi:hypothetical protein
MRKLIISCLLVSSLPALADSGASLAPIDPVRVPAVCREVSPMPHDSRTVTTALAASLTAANCMAEMAMNTRIFIDTDGSIATIDGAMAPSVAMFDAIVAQGDPAEQIIALHAKGDLYTGLVVRMRNALPPAPTGTGHTFEVATSDWQLRHAILEDKLEPWLVKADRAFQTVAELGVDHPELVARNPVLLHDVRVAQRTRRLGVAAR